MLSGRRVALGGPRRLSPHSTASSHLSFERFFTRSRPLHLDSLCCSSARVTGSGSAAAVATGPSTSTPIAGTFSRPGVGVSSLPGCAATSLCGSSRAALTIVSGICRTSSTSGGNRCPGGMWVRACCCGTVSGILTDAHESHPKCCSGSSSMKDGSKVKSDCVSASASSSGSGTGNGSSSSCSSSRSIGTNGRRANSRNTPGDVIVAAATVVRGESEVCSLVEDTTPDNWLAPLRRPGSVVALGKFDALHKGHRALAATAAALVREIHASSSACDPDNNTQFGGTGACGDGAKANVGDAILLSFSGMAAVLGWPDRLPLTAPQDRGRVLSGWATACSAGGRTDANSYGGRVSDAEVPGESVPPPPGSSGIGFGAERNAGASLGAPAGAALPPRLRTLPFSLIRGMSPEQFVTLLARDLGAAGVVAGRNYRFGYKAAGDADTLVRLGHQYGMRVAIVDLVTLPDQSTTTANSRGSSWSSTDGSAASVGSKSSSHDDNSGSARSSRSSSSGATDGCGTKQTSDSNQQIASETAGRSVIREPDLELQYSAGGTSSSKRGDGGSGGSGGNGGSGSTVGTSSRVSSSRIRELLERGQVESVEQLLGRKYRLVCDLKIAATITHHNSNRINNDMRSAVGVNGGNDDGAAFSGHDGCESRRLMVPYAAFQNQPPGNGHYRALVQWVRGSQVLVEVDLGLEGGEASFGAVGDVREMISAPKQMSGGVCMMVELSDLGIEMDLTEADIEHVLNGCDEGLLLVDFDACG